MEHDTTTKATNLGSTFQGRTAKINEKAIAKFVRDPKKTSWTGRFANKKPLEDRLRSAVVAHEVSHALGGGHNKSKQYNNLMVETADEAWTLISPKLYPKEIGEIGSHLKDRKARR